MKILRETGLTVFAGCYTPCQQGSSGGNKPLTMQEDARVIVAGCYTPCQQGSSGGNIIAKRNVG